MASLHEIGNDRVCSLRKMVTLIGRDPKCDIVATDGRVSAQHAMIVRSGGGHYIEDLESDNGTCVNGVRIRHRTQLRANDRLEIFGLVFSFHEDEQRPFTPVPGAARVGPTTTVEAPPSVLSSLDVGDRLGTTVAPESKLRAVLEISQKLGTSLDLEEVLPKILGSLFTIFPHADRGLILLVDPNTGKLVPKAVRSRQRDTGSATTLSRTILEYALRTRRAVLSADAGHDERFGASESIQRLELRSILCVPILSQSESILGIIELAAWGMKSAFHQEDLDVLLAASIQAARAIELGQLYRQRRELEAAREIQKGFLPQERPAIEGLRFFDYYAAAQHVGGDYYDYISLPGHCLAAAVGDVSGKGVAAALLMARLSSAARFCLATTPSLPEAVRQLSLALGRGLSDDRFVTFLVAVIDLSRFTMCLVNAGHAPPLLRKAGQVEAEEIAPESAGLPLAVFDQPYEATTVQLEPGDMVVLYTDGVTETKGASGELYGVERLRGAMSRAAPEVEAVGQAILTDVRQFGTGRPQGDDLALVCFGRQR